MVPQCQLLGATAPWLDPKGDFSTVGVHCLADGDVVVQSAREFVDKVMDLKRAGLSCRTGFLVLKAFSQGHVTHLLRANYEVGGWAQQFDDVLLGGLEQLVGCPLNEEQREQVFLRLADGGLGFSSASQALEAAFLGSWALCLQEVAGALGVQTWEGFRVKCTPVAEDLSRAEAKLIQDSGGGVQKVDWVGLFSEPKDKLQSFRPFVLYDVVY